jgi:hypothetical protein
MSYLYGKRFVGRITGLILSLRQELYYDPYHQINWNKARNTIAKVSCILILDLCHTLISNPHKMYATKPILLEHNSSKIRGIHELL